VKPLASGTSGELPRRWLQPVALGVAEASVRGRPFILGKRAAVSSKQEASGLVQLALLDGAAFQYPRVDLSPATGLQKA
jgi:hypothetical protein